MSQIIIMACLCHQASPKGQIVFDRLLKACNEVVWEGESIIVLKSIQVDPPYMQDNCKLLQPGSGQGNLDRVQKIVSSLGDGSQ
jgi:Anticodon-binding domain